MSSRRGGLTATLLAAAAAASGLAGCVSKGDLQLVQGEVALLRAESLRRDSTRAAQLAEVIQMQRQIMDSLATTRRTVAQVKGDVSQDLYNIQQQLVQLQELTGQSQQRLSELRTQLEARAAQQNDTPAPGQAPTTPGDSARPTGAPSASADAMYEASLAQLRRGSTTTARLGLREMLRTYPNSSARARRAVLHRPELRGRESGLGGRVLLAGRRPVPHLGPRPLGAVQPGPPRRAAEGQRQGEGRLPARGAEVPPVGRGRAGT